MPVPAVAGRRRHRVVLEDRGVVDEDADRAERRGGPRQQALDGVLVGEIGAKCDGGATLPGDFADQVLMFQVRARDAHRLSSLPRQRGGNDGGIRTQERRAGRPAILSDQRQTGRERRPLEAGRVDVLTRGRARQRDGHDGNTHHNELTTIDPFHFGSPLQWRNRVG